MLKNTEDDIQNASTVWYLPHHPVVNLSKSGKLRVVFDCAAKFNGTFLNDKLMKGPDLVNSLVGVLTRFKKNKVALVADVKAMFHQINVDPRDQNALRFLWWNKEDLYKESKVYKMVVHPFGATSSPSCANFCLKQTAREFGHLYPSMISEAVLHCIKNKTKRFPVFVANRLAIIEQNTELDCWRHVPSNLNPADLASRGVRANSNEMKK